MGLKDIRGVIDSIDSKLLALLRARMECALIAQRFKKTISDPSREKEILSRASRSSGRLLEPKLCKQLFRDILRMSKGVQQHGYRLIAFRGEHGNYNELAAMRWNNALVPIPCKDVDDVFEGVSSGRYDYGIMPIENTLDGYVGPSSELLLNTSIFVVAAFEIPIHHCLLALPGTDHRDIRTVYSHPHILAQCKRFLRRNKLTPTFYTDSGAAAKWLSQESPAASAVISSRHAAHLYHLDILKENIEDIETNRTRFFVLARNKVTRGTNKCSVVFSTDKEVTSLFSILEGFVRRRVTLTNVASVPRELGRYTYMIEFMASDSDHRARQLIADIHRHATRLKCLGHYAELKITAAESDHE